MCEPIPAQRAGADHECRCEKKRHRFCIKKVVPYTHHSRHCEQCEILSFLQRGAHCYGVDLVTFDDGPQ